MNRRTVSGGPATPRTGECVPPCFRDAAGPAGADGGLDVAGLLPTHGLPRPATLLRPEGEYLAPVRLADGTEGWSEVLGLYVRPRGVGNIETIRRVGRAGPPYVRGGSRGDPPRRGSPNWKRSCLREAFRHRRRRGGTEGSGQAPGSAEQGAIGETWAGECIPACGRPNGLRRHPRRCRSESVDKKRICLKMLVSDGVFSHVLLKACFCMAAADDSVIAWQKEPPFPGRERGVRFG